MAVVYLRWQEGEQTFQAVHENVKGAQAQAAVEGNRAFLGIYDGPHEDAKKLADVKGASNG